jgi:transposase
MESLLADLSPWARERLKAAIEERIQTAKAPLELQVQLLREELRLARLDKYGAKSEKLTDAQLALLDLEPVVHANEVVTEAEATEADEQEIKAILAEAKATVAAKSKKEHRGRAPLPGHLRREITVVPCAPESCSCKGCGGEKVLIGYEESEELAHQPAVLFVRVIKREKRACRQCEELGVSTAAVPAKILPKAKASNELIVSVLTGKFVEHLPLYRLAARFFRESQVDLSRAVLGDWMSGVGYLLQGISRAMWAELLREDYLQVDETRVPVQTRTKPGKNHQAYLWEYSRPRGTVIFDFQMGRSREGPRQMLGEFAGIVQCDGYNAYDKFGGEGLIFAGCWAHARRGFVDAVKAAGKDPVALRIVAQINALYRIEREAREMQLGPQERLRLRQEKSLPLMARLRAAIELAQESSTPASALGKACAYTINQWKRLQVYLDHGQVEIDQNLCENAIRPLAIGRKNWLHLGNESVGPGTAAIYSVVETCRRLRIDVREYLLDVLPGLSERLASDLQRLTPAAWLAARKTAHPSQA